jgi:hypothetical protein
MTSALPFSWNPSGFECQRTSRLAEGELTALLQNITLQAPTSRFSSHPQIPVSHLPETPFLIFFQQYGAGPYEAMEAYQNLNPGVFAIDEEREYLKFHMHKYLVKL